MIGGACFTKKTYVELYMKLEKSIYRLGETIPVHVECKVEGGSTDVDKVRNLARTRFPGFAKIKPIFLSLNFR